MARRARSFPRFPREHLDAIVEIAARVPTSGPIDRASLEEELLAAIHACGLAHDGSEGGEIWAELTDDEAMPSPRALADAFRAVAVAECPLDCLDCFDEVGAHLNARIKLLWEPRWRRAGRGAVPNIADLDWASLSDTERDEIREIATALAESFEYRVRPGRRHRGDLDGVMFCLADIWLRYTGMDGAIDEVPYSINSRFIQFAHAVLKPSLDWPESGVDALSRRWERCVLPGRRQRMLVEGEDDGDPDR